MSSKYKVLTVPRFQRHVSVPGPHLIYFSIKRSRLLFVLHYNLISSCYYRRSPAFNSTAGLHCRRKGGHFFERADGHELEPPERDADT